MVRLFIQLNEEEAETLAKWAARELRSPNDQARFIIRQEMLRHGLLDAADASIGNRLEEEE